MNKHNKGEYGYMKAYRQGKLIVSIILVAMIEFIVITLLLMYGSTSRVMIVIAILLALPLAKFFIAFIMCVRFKPLRQEEYEQICNEATDDVEKALLYDVVISRYEGMKFYQSVCVRNGRVYALVLDSKFSENKKDYEKWVAECIADSKYKYGVTILNDINEYIKKVNSVSTPNDKTRLIDKHMEEKILTACV